MADEDADVRLTPAASCRMARDSRDPGLTQVLLTKYREDFVRTATEKLLTYALGRGVEHYDYPTVRAISREAARDNYRISSWILAVIKSTPFQMRKASES